MNRKIAYSMAVFLYLLLISASVIFAEQIPSSNLFLTPSIQNNPVFVIAVRSKGNSQASYEKIKIRFLIEAVRKSRLTFIRNGKFYKGSIAAAHLNRKYLRDGGKIFTAEDFIQIVASKSNGTGKPYLFENAMGEIVPLKDVLHYELERLEQSLADIKSNQT